MNEAMEGYIGPTIDCWTLAPRAKAVLRADAAKDTDHDHQFGLHSGFVRLGAFSLCSLGTVGQNHSLILPGTQESRITVVAVAMAWLWQRRQRLRRLRLRLQWLLSD